MGLRPSSSRSFRASRERVSAPSLQLCSVSCTHQTWTEQLSQEERRALWLLNKRISSGCTMQVRPGTLLFSSLQTAINFCCLSTDRASWSMRHLQNSCSSICLFRCSCNSFLQRSKSKRSPTQGVSCWRVVLSIISSFADGSTPDDAWYIGLKSVACN